MQHRSDLPAGVLVRRFIREIVVNDVCRSSHYVSDVPDGGPALGELEGIRDRTATEDDRKLFAEAWHGRIQAVLWKESLFTVRTIEH